MTLANVAAAVIFVIAIIGISLTSWALARWALHRHATEETRELAGSILFRIAALHGLVLALVFAQDLLGVRDVEVSAAREATLVSDIYHDAKRYGEAETAVLREHLARYATLVVEEEWAALSQKGHLLPTAWEEWEGAYAFLLAATPATPAQERLHTVMFADIRELSELRDRRENAAVRTYSRLFFWAALGGIMLISAAYFTWPATALNLGLISAFSGYTGMILYMIIAFSDPFSSPGRASASGFERFLTPEVRTLAGTAA